MGAAGEMGMERRLEEEERETFSRVNQCIIHASTFKMHWAYFNEKSESTLLQGQQTGPPLLSNGLVSISKLKKLPKLEAVF